MHFPKLMQLAIPLLLTSLNSCSTLSGVTPKSAVLLPAPPAFMGACKPSGVKVGDAPNIAFDTEHASFKQCSRQGAASRSWYSAVRTRYAGAKLK